MRAGRWLAGAGAALLGAPAMAQTPHNWETGFQKPFSPVQQQIEGLYSFINWMMVAVVVLVLVLIGYVVYRYRASKNPVASRVSHHTSLEVAWTLLPVLILVAMVIPSFRLIYFEDRTPNADMTLKVIGHQWYWQYEYPDQGDFSFVSNMIQDDDLKPNDIRHLSVDNEVVLPAGKNVRILLTGADVIHSFFIPSLGVQRYAIPGRLIETWVKVNQPGDYYGECNQICGVNHSAMPIHIRAVSEAEFAAWAAQAKTKYADAAPSAPVAVAANAR